MIDFSTQDLRKHILKKHHKLRLFSFDHDNRNHNRETAFLDHPYDC